MKKQLNKKGFTLIEVVLVLAIGGLIFLLAFLAFQQVSTNRRDTQRRSNADRIIAELQNFKGDKGRFPTVDNIFAPDNTNGFEGVFKVQYMKDLEDPSGYSYLTTNVTSGMVVPIDYSGAGFGKWWPLQYGLDRKCNSSGGFANQEGIVAVMIRLEKGVVCRDSQ